MIFNKSLTRELTVTAFGVFTVLLSLIMSTQAIKLLGYAAEGQIANKAVGALIAFLTLRFFPMLLILTIFVSVIIVFTRLWRDHEMVIWLCAGLSLKDFIRPVLQFSLPLSLLVGGISLGIGPWAEQRSLQYTETLKHREDFAAISPGIFKEPTGTNYVYFVEGYETKRGEAKHIFLQDLSNKKRVATLLAEKAHIKTDKEGKRILILEDGRRYEGVVGDPSYEVMQFSRVKIAIGDSQPLIDLTNHHSSANTSLLWKLRELPDARGELAWRISMPISCVILSLLGIALSYFNPRSGHSFTFGLAILVYFLYQNILTLLRTEIANNQIHYSSVILLHVFMLLLAVTVIVRCGQPALNVKARLTQLFKKQNKKNL